MVVHRRAVFAEESAEVEVLYANLDKMKSLTKKIQTSMSRLETSGKTVQEAIGPIYGSTQKLQTTNTNIDRIILAIDRIREPLDMRNKEERVIRSTPQSVGLSEYTASIDRTRQALRDMKQTNLRSNQQAISELNALLRAGTQQLEDVFKDVLREGQQPVEPLHFITKAVDFPRLPSGKTSQLRTINTYVSSSAAESDQDGHQGTSIARVYADVRGQYITLSLQNLAAASLATARKQNSDVLYKRGDNAIGTYAAGILGMSLAEYDSICPIFAREDWGRVLSLTCQNPLNAFSATLRDLDKHVRENMGNDCFMAYEIIEIVSNISHELESKTGELKQPLSDAMKSVRETAKSSLSVLLNDARSKVQSLVDLPLDGAAIPATTKVMARLQMMTTFLVPLSSIMTSLGDGGWSSPNTVSPSSSAPTLKSFDVGADGTVLFAHYANDTLETLLSNLDAKARATLKGKSLQGVFLANNIAVIDRMIRSSELQPLLGSSQAKIESWRKKSTALYLDSWKEPSAQLLDVQYTNRGVRPPSTGQAVDSATVLKVLSSKDKDQIKEKFRNFNTSFDELVAKHKALKMEREVRSGLAKEVTMFIEALYGRFWDRYHEIDKGKGKYVKYDKAQLGAVLASLG